MATKRRKIGPKRLGRPDWIERMLRGDQMSPDDPSVGTFDWLLSDPDPYFGLPRYMSDEGHRLRLRSGLLSPAERAALNADEAD
jgi:hypothetical protein